MLKLNLTTKRLKIRRFCTDDIDQVSNLFQNRQVLYYYLPNQFQTVSQNDLYDYLSDWDDDETAFLFSCFLKEDLIAIFSLEDFSKEQSHTECGIALVDEQYYGQGYATEIIAKMLEVLFEQLDLHRVYIRYIEGNNASLKLFSKFGFKVEGCLREHIKRDPIYLDMYYMGLLKSEFRENKIDLNLGNEK